MKSVFEVLLVVAAVIAIVNGECDRVEKKVSNTKELVAALDIAAPGWTINVAKGIYHVPGWFGTYEFNRSGEAGCPITITSDHIGEAILNGSLRCTGSYLVIANLTFNRGDPYFQSTLVFDCRDKVDVCKNVTAENIHFDAGIGLQTFNVKWATVRNCSFKGLEDIAIYSGGNTSESVFEKCFFGDYAEVRQFSGTVQSAIQFFLGGNNYNVIRDNVFYGNGYLYEEDASWIDFSRCRGCHHNEIYRNVFQNPDNATMTSGIKLAYPGVPQVTSHDNYVRGNTMVINTGKGDYAITVGYSKGNTICASNKVSGNTVFTDSKVIDNSC